jgi:hypothetical protein
MRMNNFILDVEVVGFGVCHDEVKCRMLMFADGGLRDL